MWLCIFCNLFILKIFVIIVIFLVKEKIRDDLNLDLGFFFMFLIDEIEFFFFIGKFNLKGVYIGFEIYE